MINYVKINGKKDIKYYHDLVDIPGYGNNNLFEISFMQGNFDFINQKHLYENIELTQNILNLDCYNPFSYDFEVRQFSKYVIDNFFIPNDEFKLLLAKRHLEINFDNTIGVHRRATDIYQHHKVVDLQKIFNTIESQNFKNIFLMCDNSDDTLKFKKRYGNMIITYDDFTSINGALPFFKENKNHINELIFGVFTLSKTKTFICSKSNLSTFSILINPNLTFKLIS
jgi:hypothetical protein